METLGKGEELEQEWEEEKEENKERERRVMSERGMEGMELKRDGRVERKRGRR